MTCMSALPLGFACALYLYTCYKKATDFELQDTGQMQQAMSVAHHIKSLN